MPVVNPEPVTNVRLYKLVHTKNVRYDTEPDARSAQDTERVEHAVVDARIQEAEVRGPGDFADDICPLMSFLAQA